MAEVRYEVQIGPSSGTSSTGYDLSQELQVDLRFVNLASPMQAGGPDIVGEIGPDSAYKRRVRESLDQSVRENAGVWRDLSKR